MDIHIQKLNFDSYPPNKNVTSKYIRDLKAKLKLLKFEDDIEENMCDLALGENFLDETSEAHF